MGKYGKHWALVRALALACGLVLTALPAQACRLALVLAMDVSNSVDEEEDALQRQGLAAALLAQDVQDAFFISPQPVSLFVFEWSGEYHQQVILDWMEILTPADLLVASETVRTSERGIRDFPTAMGAALGFAANRLRDKDHCLAKTIDVAGDGANNDGFGPSSAYKAFPFANVTVNGLVVDASILKTRDDLIAYYRDEVIRGPGAFIEVADGFAAYENAMRRKLVRELLAQMIGQTAPVAAMPRG